MRLNPLVFLVWNLSCFVPVLFSLDQITAFVFVFLTLIMMLLKVPGRLRLWLVLSLMGAISGLWTLAVYLLHASDVNILEKALALALRSWAMISISAGLVLSVNLCEVIEVLMQRLKLSPRWGFSLQLATNLFFRLANEVRLIRHIHRIRQPSRSFRFSSPVLAVLATALRQAQQSCLSMTLRGLDQSKARTWLFFHAWTWADTLLAALGIIIPFTIWMTLTHLGMYQFCFF